MESEHVHQELIAAENALRKGRYDEADRHLNAAAHAGAPPERISDLGRKLRYARAHHAVRVKKSVRIGSLLGIGGYLLLSVKSPLGWGQTVWEALAFLVIPALMGLLIGRRHAGERTPGAAFADGLKAGLMAMALYASVHLISSGCALDKDAGDAGEEFVAGLFTFVLFSLLAGLVSGLISALSSRIGERIGAGDIGQGGIGGGGIGQGSAGQGGSV